MLRFLRLVRMLRWVKLRRVNEVFQEYFHSQAGGHHMGFKVCRVLWSVVLELLL